MKLVIAEKPSVAQTIAKVLGATHRGNGYIENNSYIISWCIGHLVGLATPDSYGNEYKNWHNLPIIPTNWLYTINPKTKAQFSILKKLMNDKRITSIVCATDAGREGELIFRLVYNQAKCNKPIERLWISSLEDNAIRKGFENLRSSKEFDNLYKSALCRERADWLVGINATRFFTTLYKSDKPLSIGRVQTPTLAMLVQRDNDINNFIKKKYYTVEINCGEYTAFSEKFTDFGQADKLQKLCKIAKAKVVDISTEEKKINPPRLYDLTTLQRDANRIYGFTAQQTLDTVQRLYDNRLSTYPRTDSQYLTEDMEETARMVISAIMNKTQFAEHTQYTVKNANIQSVINNKKVSDHHAIIPTINIETTDFCNLTDMDRKILYLISARLLSATAEQHIYENTMVTLDCNGYKFTAKGKAVIRKGYKQILDNFFNCVRIKQDAEDKTLPNIQFDNEYNVTSKTVEHYTQPPKPFTEDTLLSVMERAGNEDYATDDVERKGLGTPATRASIIETIISRGYAQRNKKQLVPTDMGKKLIECVPEKLKSAKLTAEWENRLTLIAKGESNSLDFMRDIVDFVNQFIDNNKNINVNVSLFSSKEVIGKCPRCGAEVYEGTSNFYCSEDGCSFVLWKKNKFFESKKKEITKAVAKSLLSTGRVHCKDLYSPTKGKNYEADIVLDDTGEYINFKLVF